MFEARQTNTMKRNLFSVLEVTYHASIQKARSSRRNSVWAIMTSILRANRFALGNFIRAAHVQRHSDLPQLESRFDDLPFGVVFWLWRWAGVSRDAPVVPRFAQQAYVRINMVASGKMFVTNIVPGFDHFGI